MQENPSLQTYLPEAIPAAYESELDLVVRETPLDYLDLPCNCSYTLAGLLNPDFPPGIKTTQG